MSEAPGRTVVEQARTAAAQNAWPQAYDLFLAADGEAPLGAPDLALLAEAAYTTGHLEMTFDAWERAYAVSLADGDDVAAAGAAVKVAMHLLIDTALLAPIRGWTARVERLLDGHDATPVHAWLAVARAYERVLTGNFADVEEWARLAVEIGTAHDEPAAAAMGRMAHARALIFLGRIDEGLRLLDEAALAAFSGELDHLTIGMVFCELLCACRGIAQYDRAEEWTDAMERYRDAQGVGSMGGRCRIHRAELLHLRGETVAAEHEASKACDELQPYMRLEFGWPLTELGRIRLRMGDLDGAEEVLLRAHEIGWDAQPWLALLRLARGDAVAAAASIRDALDHPLNVPSKEFPPNTDLRRAPLLEAQVEIEIAVGDLDRARTAADELLRIAATFASKPLGATASLARASVILASGAADAAVRAFHEALALWNEVGAPHEAAVARMGLGRAYRAEGNEERALLEFGAARTTFERIGAARHADAAARAVGAPVDAPTSIATGNVFRKEGDYWSVVFGGATVRVRHLKGMGYIARLLADPGREFHALDLATEGASATGLIDAGDAGEMLDATAKEMYRRRLADIDADIEEAKVFGDIVRAERAEAERDHIVKELARAVGLDGRDRRAGAASERARASVTQAVRHAIARLGAHHATLGAHLERTIRTGTFCAYAPEPRPEGWSWQR